MAISRVATLSLLFPLLTAVACGGSSKPAEAPSATSGKSGPPEVGKPAPDLSIQTLNGQGDVKLDALAGKVVLIDFWATWCAPCKQSFPALEALSKRYGSKLTVIGVSVNDESDGVAEFAKEMGTTFPIGWDKGHTLAERWNVSTMPSSFLVDDKGTVRFVHAGYREGDDTEIEKQVSALLGKSAPPEEKSAKAEKPATDAASAAAPPTGGDPASDDAAESPPAETKKPAAKPTKKKAPPKNKKPKRAQKSTSHGA